jgi:hypothetical protein
VVRRVGTDSEIPLLELLGLVRPFPELKALDMDKVIADIVTQM